MPIKNQGTVYESAAFFKAEILTNSHIQDFDKIFAITADACYAVYKMQCQ